MHPHSLRPLRGPATAAVATLAVAAAAEIFWVLGGPHLAPTVSRLVEEAGPQGPDGLAVAATFLLLRYLAHAVAAVAFVVWLLRARANADSLSRVPHRWPRILAVLGWFLPVLNWWIPKQIVDDVWAVSRPGGVRGEHIGKEVHSWLIWAWWVSWLLGFWVLPLAAGLLLAMGAPDSLASGSGSGAGSGFDAYGLAVTLVAAALAVAVVLRITRCQEGRRAWAGAGSPP
ncbi:MULTISPECIES: DUF4328 domain-containing protein [Streptosporangium]|uniref:DUF4328 domain-containing protein n=1 Tax=Streptosporangium brasiliense TaxID=47480 RepID=A0ABT9R930_9ACTN|nr:DUF4328 domain-containing protein [Streptosporangium brasiliense]MDP9865386.1 hypothetical protein [Streptosporangium brasiliense]